MNFTDLLDQVKTQEQYVNIIDITQNIDKVKRYAKKHKLNEKEVIDAFFTEDELRFYTTLTNSIGMQKTLTSSIINCASS